MPRYAITGPDRMQYDWLTGDSPLEALHKLHAEDLGCDAIRLVDGRLVFVNQADRALCSGVWRVIEFWRNGTASSVIEIPAPVPVAA
jgi:hypothetical protein